MNKRLFIVTYYWPPAGGPGVQRWLGFSKHLHSLGWQITVIRPRGAAYPLTDPGLNQQVPEGLKVEEVPIWEPGQLGRYLFPKMYRTMGAGILPEKNPTWSQKLLLQIRANVFVPDSRVAWVVPLVNHLSRALQTASDSLLITTGPPHSVHLAGLKVKKSFPDLTWIADFRDPWTGISYHDKLPLLQYSMRRHQELEKRVLANADHIMVTSESTAREFAQLTDTAIAVFTNGYDMENPDILPDPDFRFTHVGSLLTERNPPFLWAALGKLGKVSKTYGADFQLQFCGAVSEEVVKDLDVHGLGDCVTHMGYMPHQEIPFVLARSQVLLLIEADGVRKREIIPGKLFEYLQSRRPILAIGPRDWEAGRMIRELKAGYFIEYGEGDQLDEVLAGLLQEYRHHQGQIPAVKAPIESYSRRSISERLSDFLHGART